MMRVGILGCGNVGGALVRLIHDHADVIEARAGVPLEVARVAVRDLTKERDVPLPAGVLHRRRRRVVGDPDVDIVVEVIGGIEPARRADRRGAEGRQARRHRQQGAASPTHGRELFETAEGAGVDLLFEASVAGGIPLIRPLRESLAGDRIRRVMGIVNGTTNYILTRMTEEGASFADALAEAQSARVRRDATPPPTSRASTPRPRPRSSRRSRSARASSPATCTARASPSITADDIASARDLGYVVKLLAVAEEHRRRGRGAGAPGDGPEHHPLASVRDSFNAVFIEGDAVGELMLYGRGAGGDAHRVGGARRPHRRGQEPGGGAQGRDDRHAGAASRSAPIDDVESQFYLQLEVADRPGVLAAIAGEFGEHGVSIRSMQQRGIGDDARLIFVTHRAREADLRDTVAGAARRRAPCTGSARCCG